MRSPEKKTFGTGAYDVGGDGGRVRLTTGRINAERAGRGSALRLTVHARLSGMDSRLCALERRLSPAW